MNDAPKPAEPPGAVPDAPAAGRPAAGNWLVRRFRHPPKKLIGLLRGVLWVAGIGIGRAPDEGNKERAGDADTGKEP